jgi:ATP-binding cassette subfamily B multidrug efflux pump
MLKPVYQRFETWLDPFAGPKPQELPTDVLQFIWYFLRQAKWQFGLVLLLSGIIGLVEAGLYASVGWIIDTLRASNPETVWRDNAWMFAGMAFAVLVVRTLAMSLSSIVSEQTIAPSFFALVRWQTHRRVLRQSYSFFQDDFAGRIATKVMQSGQSIGDFVLNLIQGIWQFIIFTVFSFALFAALDWRLALLLSVWFAGYFFALYRTLGEIRDRSQNLSYARSSLNGRIVDSYTNIQTVKLFAANEREDAFVREGVTRMVDAMQALGRYVSGLRVVLVTMNGLMITLTGLISIMLWQAGEISIGSAAVALGLVLRLNHMSGWISFQINGLFRELGTIQDTINTVSQPITVVDRPDAKPLRVTQGAIAFEDINFAYGQQVAAINDLTLEIAPGEKVGLVGRSGAGKSTLVNLLLRLHDIEHGRILVDGQDIANVTQDSLRSRIGVVTQDTSLLHRSVYDNIAYGRPNATPSEVEQAARKARAHDFIGALKDVRGRDGYSAHVGERGVKLSGGQRQRIAIARIFLKDAPILVLDEATSALDSEVEAAIQEQLTNLMDGKTVLAIAHRLSTIAAMDRLVVMDAGRIVEMGTHAELIERDGIYADLWSRQSGGFLPETLDDAASAAE